jgi:hypothetical protein
MQKLIRYILVGLILVNFLYCVSGVIHYPLASIDEVSIWMLKAKFFYMNGVFPLKNLNTLGYGHLQYPILLPLVFYWIFKIIGSYREIYVLLFYPFVYLLVIYLCYETLILLKLKKNWALLSAYIYSMLSPLLAMGGRMHVGEADIFIVLAYWLAIIFYLLFLKYKKEKWLIFTTLVIAIASNIKMEGVFLSTIFFFVPINKTKRFLLFMLSVIPLLVWNVVRANAGVQSDLGFYVPGFIEIIKRGLEVFYLTIEEVINVRNWYIFWPIFVLSFIFTRKRDILQFKTNIALFFLIFSIFSANYVFSTLAPEEYAASSLDRILLQLSAIYFPIFAYQSRRIVARIIK